MFPSRAASAVIAAIVVASIVTPPALAQQSNAARAITSATLLPEHWKPSLDSSTAPLVLTDPWGRVISEQEIRQRMNSGFSFKNAGYGLLIGLSAGIGAAVKKNDADCSIYEPCTEREKFLQSAPFVGAVIGLFVGSQIGHISRVDAIQQIMADRRGGSR
jgi:hypothetical protein